MDIRRNLRGEFVSAVEDSKTPGLCSVLRFSVAQLQAIQRMDCSGDDPHEVLVGGMNFERDGGSGNFVSKMD